MFRHHIALCLSVKYNEWFGAHFTKGYSKWRLPFIKKNFKTWLTIGCHTYHQVIRGHHDRKSVLIDIAFNMEPTWISRFPHITMNSVIFCFRTKTMPIYIWFVPNHYIGYLDRFYKRFMSLLRNCPDSKVHGANMGPIWGRQDLGRPHGGPMDLIIWVF